MILLLSYNLCADEGIIENPIIQFLEGDRAPNRLHEHRPVRLVEDEDHYRNEIDPYALLSFMVPTGIVGGIIAQSTLPESWDFSTDAAPAQFKMGAGAAMLVTAMLLNNPVVARRANRMYEGLYSFFCRR